MIHTFLLFQAYQFEVKGSKGSSVQQFTTSYKPKILLHFQILKNVS